MVANLNIIDALMIPVVKTRKAQVMADLGCILAGSIFIALMSQISIHLPFTPVPITGQTFAVLLIALSFGLRRGTLTLLTYITEGAMNLPVFASGGFGIAHLIGPTGGYLMGFVITAVVVGYLADKGFTQKMSLTLLAMILGNLLIYLCGVLWLSNFLGIGKALMAGCVPFILGDILKIGITVIALPSAWKLIK